MGKDAESISFLREYLNSRGICVAVTGLRVAMASLRSVLQMCLPTCVAFVLTGCASEVATTGVTSTLNAGASSQSAESTKQAEQALKLLQASISTFKVANDGAVSNLNQGGAGYRRQSTYSQSYVGDLRRFGTCSGTTTVTAFSGTLDHGGPVVAGPVSTSGTACSRRHDASFADLDVERISISPQPAPRVAGYFASPYGYTVTLRCRAGVAVCVKGTMIYNNETSFTVADEATARNAKTAIEILVSYNSR